MSLLALARPVAGYALPYYLGVASLVALALWYESWAMERRLRRWADEKGYRLVSWTRAWPWEGPRAWARWKHQQDVRVEIEDRRGARRGWLMMDWGWLGFGSVRLRAVWDGCMPEDRDE